MTPRPAIDRVLREAGLTLTRILPFADPRALAVYGRFERSERVRSPMLEMRPGCECCDRDLPPDADGARICSFECTFCRECAERVLGGRCPNCGGELVPRPRRPADKLAKFPASATRVHKPAGCRP